MSTVNLRIREASIRHERNEKALSLLLQNENVKNYVQEKEKSSYDRGFSEGYKSGFQKKSEEIASLVNSITALFSRFNTVKTELVRQIEPQLIELTRTAVEKILSSELASGSAKIGAIIGPVLANIPSIASARVRINPADIQMMKEFVSEDQLKRKTGDVEIVPDDSVSRGGCFVETNVGVIDATIETRTRLVLDSMKE